MPTIDFYLTTATTPNEQMRFTCRLLEKAYSQQYTSYVHVANQAAAQTMYDMLWTFRDISFVPHALVDGANSDNAAIIIGSDAKPLQQHDILVNLHPEVPAFFTSYKRVIEVVYQDKEWQKLARQHYKLYQNDGYEIKTHDLR